MPFQAVPLDSDSAHQQTAGPVPPPALIDVAQLLRDNQKLKQENEKLKKSKPAEVGGKRLEGEALSKRVSFRVAKISKAMDDAQTWKPRFKQREKTFRGTFEVDMEEEVFKLIFKHKGDCKETAKAITVTGLQEDRLIGLHSKSFRFGACTDLCPPLKVVYTKETGTMKCTFNFTVLR